MFRIFTCSKLIWFWNAYFHHVGIFIFVVQVVKTLDSLVMAMVIPSWKGMQESSQQMKTVLEPTIKDKKDELAAVQRKVMWDLSGT